MGQSKTKGMVKRVRIARTPKITDNLSKEENILRNYEILSSKPRDIDQRNSVVRKNFPETRTYIGHDFNLVIDGYSILKHKTTGKTSIFAYVLGVSENFYCHISAFY